MADDQRPFEFQLFDEAFKVRDLALKAIVRGRFPFAVAMTALVEGDTVVALAQHQANEIPGMGVQAAAMQKEYGMAPLGAPIEIMQPHPADHHVMRFRQGDLGQLQPGVPGGELEMIDLFGGA